MDNFQLHSPRIRLLAGLVTLGVAWVAATDVGAAPADKKRSTSEKQSSDPLPVVADVIRGLPAKEGLLAVSYDPATARVLLVLPAPEDARGRLGSWILVESLSSGLGSNPIGLDRGQIGRSRLVEFRRIGSRVWMEQPNLGFRAGSDDASERSAVEESFATSTLWSGAIVGEDRSGSVVIDWTSFLTSDVHDVAGRLRAAGEGSFRLDPERSAVDVASLHVFPDNLEVDARVTWSADDPGAEVRAVTPSPNHVTLTQHLSLVRLPNDDFRPRSFDPRAGSFSIGYADYAVPLTEPLQQKLAVRHRLPRHLARPGQAPGVEPLVYYVDPGVPEPVRSALIEGASWWAAAFEAAGFADGFRVELLPAGVHPLDIRYNVIEWVHRQTRGWSYGGGVIDPRTGEMIKGHVNLGSLRVRQDRLLFEALLGVGSSGSGAPDDPVELALARIRQLAAHEVGHTLGLSHNFAASSYDGRASVMDYPAPWVKVSSQGRLDVSRAYGVGVGSWDVQAIHWLHGSFPNPQAERLGLEEILQAGIREGRFYLTDSDARPSGAAHPRAHLWDNGSDSIEELHDVFAVRRLALDRFGKGNLAAGRPLAELEEILVPLFLYHRYQLRAAARSIGGVDYAYTINHERVTDPIAVPESRQREALKSILRGLEPLELDLPESILAILPPRPPGSPSNRETFRGRTAPTFDALGAALAAADLVFDELLDPSRASRLEEQLRRGLVDFGFEELLASTTETLLTIRPGETLRLRTLKESLQRRWAERLHRLAVRSDADSRVRARAERSLNALVVRLREGSLDQRHTAESAQRFLDRQDDSTTPVASELPPPPGSPIGNFGDFGISCSLDHGTWAP